MKQKNFLVKIIVFLSLCFISLTFIYPLIFMLINSLKSKIGYAMDPFGLPKGKLEIGNYIAMISQFKILNLFKNTGIIVVISCAIVITISVFASYAFAKLEFKGRKFVYLCVFATILIPGQATLIPMYVMFSKVNLINNYWSVILAYIGVYIPQNITLMTAFFKGISNELIEAGNIDGCNYFQVIRNIIIPLGRPVIFINIIFNSIYIWNDLFTPMIFLQRTEVSTVMVALASLMQRYNSAPTFQFAGLMLSTVPCIVIFVLFQSYIVKGITMGSIK